jgi:hypothetical protein
LTTSGYFALLDTAAYSSSTSGHQSDIRRAVSHLPRLSLGAGSGHGGQSPQYLGNTVTYTIEAAKNACLAAARTRKYTGGLFRRALQTVETVQVFDGLFNPAAPAWPLDGFCTEAELRGAVQAFGGENTGEIPSPEGTAFYARLRKEAGLTRAQARKGNAEATAERERINQLVAVARAEYAPVYCAAWKRGESPSTIIPCTPGAPAYALDMYALPVMLRLKSRGEGHCPVVQTSKGAEFPYRPEDCTRIFHTMTAIRQGMDTSAARCAELSELPKFGAFKIDELTGDKIRAGCHEISWEEIRDFILRTQPEIIGQGE